MVDDAKYLYANVDCSIILVQLLQSLVGAKIRVVKLKQTCNTLQHVRNLGPVVILLCSVCLDAAYVWI